MSTFDDIISAAQSLTSAERGRLIEHLWEHAPPHDWASPKEPWITEANERSDALDAGEMTCSPWEDVKERTRRKAGLDG